MPFNLPAGTPSTGAETSSGTTTYVYDATNGVYEPEGSEGSTLSYTYDSTLQQWEATLAQGGFSKVVSSVQTLPSTGLNGSICFVAENSKLYIRLNNGWRSFEDIDASTAPTMTNQPGPEIKIFIFDTDTSTTTSIVSYTATDPENDQITYTPTIVSNGVVNISPNIATTLPSGTAQTYTATWSSNVVGSDTLMVTAADTSNNTVSADNLFTFRRDTLPVEEEFTSGGSVFSNENGHNGTVTLSAVDPMRSRLLSLNLRNGPHLFFYTATSIGYYTTPTVYGLISTLYRRNSNFGGDFNQSGNPRTYNMSDLTIDSNFDGTTPGGVCITYWSLTRYTTFPNMTCSPNASHGLSEAIKQQTGITGTGGSYIILWGSDNNTDWNYIAKATTNLNTATITNANFTPYRYSRIQLVNTGNCFYYVTNGGFQFSIRDFRT